MMMWEFEAYLNGDHTNDKTSINSACDLSLGDEEIKVCIHCFGSSC